MIIIINAETKQEIAKVQCYVTWSREQRGAYSKVHNNANIYYVQRTSKRAR